MKTKALVTFATLALAAVLVGGCSGHEAPDPLAGRPRPPGAAPDTARQPADASEATATCAAHGAPRARCFICDAALRDPGRLWCPEHARYEDRCWSCHPELQDAQRLYCDEHGLYEDECFACHPEAPPPAAGAANTAPLMCNEHGVPEAACGICRPDAVARLAPGESLKVRLPSRESAQLVGLATAPPTAGAVADGIACYAELAFNQNKLAQLAAPVDGIIRDVMADLGDPVGENQTVAHLWSAAIAEGVARAILSHQTLARERRLHADGIAAAKDLQAAEAEHRAACQQARTLGFGEDDIDGLAARPDEPVLLALRAPFAGEIIERNAVRGARVAAGQPLFTLADRATMWAMLAIPEVHLTRVRVGQDVELAVDALPDRTFTGKLTWIAAQVDARTRMARARAEVANADGALRDRMFARARIVTRHAPHALWLPPAAFQRVDDTAIVFVKQADDLYDARAVRVGATLGDRVEVLAGLRPGEAVVVRQAFTVKSQLLLARLGAGCAHD